jgi:hypothetical protein
MRRIALAVLFTLPLAAQTPAELLRQALDAAQSAKTLQTKFTRFDLEHNQNRNEKGKLFSDRLTLYEDTYIAELPYKRVVEVNGRPLAGGDLEQERARYDQAVAQRTGLDGAARAKLIHETVIDGKVHLTELLTPAYTLTELRRETMAQTNGAQLVTHVIEAKPVAESATKSFELWITDESPTVLRMVFDVVRDERNMLHGSHGQSDYQLIDGIALPTRQVVHFYYPNSGKTITVDVDHTYTRYRKFNTSARIIEEATKPPVEP